MSNIKDVAQYTNLSIGTISNYLNGKPVRADNEQKIREAIDRLGYKPNSFGKFLRKKETQTVGVITFNIATPFVSEVFTIFEQRLSEIGYDVFFCNSHGDVELEKQKIDFLLSRGVDAIVMFPRSNTQSDVSEAQAFNIPIITLDNVINDATCSSITFDDEIAAYDATRHLIANGHTHIGCLAGHSDYHTTIKRIEGYGRALRESGIAEQHIAQDIHTVDDCMHHTIDLLHRHPDITAFLVTSSSPLIGFLNAIQSLSLRVPEDISYITFDNTDYFSILSARPTYVYQDKKKLAQTISEVLQVLLADPTKCLHQEIKTHLVLGETVKNIGARSAGISLL